MDYNTIRYIFSHLSLSNGPICYPLSRLLFSPSFPLFSLFLSPSEPSQPQWFLVEEPWESTIVLPSTCCDIDTDDHLVAAEGSSRHVHPPSWSHLIATSFLLEQQGWRQHWGCGLPSGRSERSKVHSPWVSSLPSLSLTISPILLPLLSFSPLLLVQTAMRSA